MLAIFPLEHMLFALVCGIKAFVSLSVGNILRRKDLGSSQEPADDPAQHLTLALWSFGLDERKKHAGGEGGGGEGMGFSRPTVVQRIRKNLLRGDGIDD